MTTEDRQGRKDSDRARGDSLPVAPHWIDLVVGEAAAHDNIPREKVTNVRLQELTGVSDDQWSVWRRGVEKNMREGSVDKIMRKFPALPHPLDLLSRMREEGRVEREATGSEPPRQKEERAAEPTPFELAIKLVTSIQPQDIDQVSVLMQRLRDAPEDSQREVLRCLIDLAGKKSK